MSSDNNVSILLPGDRRCDAGPNPLSLHSLLLLWKNHLTAILRVSLFSPSSKIRADVISAERAGLHDTHRGVGERLAIGSLDDSQNESAKSGNESHLVQSPWTLGERCLVQCSCVELCEAFTLEEIAHVQINKNVFFGGGSLPASLPPPPHPVCLTPWPCPSTVMRFYLAGMLQLQNSAGD